MDISDLGTPDFNLQKFVSNTQETTEWKKSSPLKTYSKKTTPQSCDKADGKSRYGRVQKPRLSVDYLSTDKKVSQYLKVGANNQMHYFKASPYAIQKPAPKSPGTPGTPRRGRPPKAVSAKIPDKIQMALYDVLHGKGPNSADNLYDIEAPAPTSTETVDPIEQIDFMPKEEMLSDSEEVINEGDWNIGDLAWGNVGGFPFWPCAVTKDPAENKYKKMKALGKNRNLKEFVHLRFFGDKGRRSWIMTSHVIPFHGLDSFQSLAEETLTPAVKKKDPKLYRSFTIPATMRKAWQAAVSEAESLREAPRHERITYFSNMFPPTPPSEKVDIVKAEPKKRGRKRKSDLTSLDSSPETKKIKLEPEDPYFSSSSVSNPMMFRPAPSTGFDIPKIKEEPVSPSKEYSSPQVQQPTLKVKTDTPSPVKVPGKRGRPPGRRKKSNEYDSTPLKRKYIKKSLDQKPKENKLKKKNEEKNVLLKEFIKDPAYEMFYDKNFDRVSAENPTLSVKDIQKFIAKMWLDVKEQKPTEFRSREGAEMAINDSSHDSKSETSSRSSSPPPIIAPSSRTPYKRGISLFAGARNDKVCQVCFKSSDEGEIFKCRGPCGQPFHTECADKPRYQNIEVKNEPKEEPVVEKKKRGRPRSVHSTPNKDFTDEVKTEYQKAQTVNEHGFNVAVNPDGSPIKRKRGRPRKDSVPSFTISLHGKLSTDIQEQQSAGQLITTPVKLPCENMHSQCKRNLSMFDSTICTADNNQPLINNDDGGEQLFKGFYLDESLERKLWGKLLIIKKEMGLQDCKSFTGLADCNSIDIVDSDNNNKTVKEPKKALNSADESVIISNKKCDQKGNLECLGKETINVIDEKNSFLVDNHLCSTNLSQVALSKEDCNDSILELEEKNNSNECGSFDKTGDTCRTKVNCTLSDIANGTSITRSIFDSVDENEVTVSNESCCKPDDSKISDLTMTSVKCYQNAETNQSIEEEVQKGENSFLHKEARSVTTLQTEIKKPPTPDEDSFEKCDPKTDKSENNTAVENTRKSNLKLLGTLRGDSFESESSNNNLIVDDSSTDDRLMIEEVSLDNNSTIDCSETKTAILSILNEDSQMSDKLNTYGQTAFVNHKKDAANNLESQATSSLDMPNLDFSDSEDPAEQIINDEQKLSNPTQKMSNREHNFNLDNESKPDVDQASFSENVLYKNTTEPNKSESSTDIDKTSQVISDSVNDSQPALGELLPAQTDGIIYIEVKKEEKEVKKFSKPIRDKSIDLSASDSKTKIVLIEENGSNGKNGTDKGKNKGGICGLCAEGKLGPCFICGTEGEETSRCGYCGKAYHTSCAKQWPQTQISETAKGRTLFHCPQHVCHTCVSDNPSAVSARFNNDRLVRCVICPATYHHGNYCVPAGSEILSMTQLICPRHYTPQRKGLHHVNASWCFLCSVGGSLICCDLCPNSFHAECLKISPPDGSFICEDCETGRYPLFGEIVWVKLGTYRWWPARILFPQEVPDNIDLLPHTRGEFAVEFFGSHDYYWVNRGRVFLYHEGDGCKSVNKSRVDELFSRGVQEASAAFIKWCEERANREANSRTYMKPPKYVKIQANRLVGNVAKNIDTKENVAQTCDCDPTKPNPCGPDSDCINRLLSVECDPEVCPAGENCCNQNFEKRNYPRLVPFKTESRGWGLKALDAIKKGSFIIEYVGEMIDEEEYRKRLVNMQKNKDENFYFLTLDKDRMLDAGPKGNVARFMNHSCDPNCETQKWTVNGDTRVGLFALEDIKPETELVFNYNLATVGDTKVECKCGAVNCAGFIGAKNNSKPSNSRVTKAAPADDKRLSTKKRKRKSKALKHSEETCFTCGNGGELLLCDDSSCPKAYHLSCLGLTKHPAGGWVCPWHQCSVCSATKVQRCTLCINSYCAEHAEGNISLNRTHGLLCFSHNPSDSGSDWSDDRTNLSEDEESVKTKPTARKNSRSRILNGQC